MFAGVRSHNHQDMGLGVQLCQCLYDRYNLQTVGLKWLAIVVGTSGVRPVVPRARLTRLVVFAFEPFDFLTVGLAEVGAAIAVKVV